MEQTCEENQDALIEKRQKGVMRASGYFFRSVRYNLKRSDELLVSCAIIADQQRAPLIRRPGMSAEAFRMAQQQRASTYDEFSLKVRDFARIVGIDQRKSHGVYGMVQTSVERLAGSYLYIRSQNDDDYIAIPWFSYIHYKKGEGVITLRMNSAVKIAMTGKPFTQVYFQFLTKYRSQYAQRLYSYLKSMPKKDVIDTSVVGLRDIMVVKKMAPDGKTIVGDRYANFNDFRKYVLDPAVQSINDFSDLKVEFDLKRGYRNKIETVLFRVTEKNIDLAEIFANSSEMGELLRAFHPMTSNSLAQAVGSIFAENGDLDEDDGLLDVVPEYSE